MPQPPVRMYEPATAREVARGEGRVLYRKKSFEFFSAAEDGTDTRPEPYEDAEQFVLRNAPGKVWQEEFAMAPYSRAGSHVVKLNDRAWKGLRRESTITGIPICDLVCQLVERAGWASDTRGGR